MGTLFFDDFTADSVDRAKWNVRETGVVVNDELQAYVDSPDTLYIEPERRGSENQVLVLHPRSRPGHELDDGRRFDFISARLDTRERFEFTHGRASARMKLPAGAGIWPAFWSMGSGEWPDTGEIDIMEYVGDTEWVSSGVHGPGYSGEAGLVNNHYFTGVDATDWHVYSVERRPGLVEFFVDDFLSYRVARPMAEFFGSWAFEDPKFLILNVAIGGIYPFKTIGVGEPHYGLPQETVNRIEEDKARVLIDWVRVDEVS